jgi:hypothetical protein
MKLLWPCFILTGWSGINGTIGVVSVLQLREFPFVLVNARKLAPVGKYQLDLSMTNIILNAVLFKLVLFFLLRTSIFQRLWFSLHLI